MFEITTLDWEEYTSDLDSFSRKLFSSFVTTGFFLLENHGIPERLIGDNRDVFMDFFKVLPQESRMRYAFPDQHHQKGYTGLNIEKGEFAAIPDMKHFFQIGDVAGKVYVDELPDLKTKSWQLFCIFSDLYKNLMRAVSHSIKLDKRTYDDNLGNSILRMIHYPAHVKPTVDDGVVKNGGNAIGMCASKHTDINIMTLLHAGEEGLQLLQEDKWTPIVTSPNVIVVNCGDMLWHLTAGLFKSGVHRVICRSNVERFSFPFFGHFSSGSIKPLAQFEPYDQDIFRFNNPNEFLEDRLKKIGLWNS